jgi:hypothetical protein
LAWWNPKKHIYFVIQVWQKGPIGRWKWWVGLKWLERKVDGNCIKMKKSPSNGQGENNSPIARTLAGPRRIRKCKDNKKELPCG